jgi:hypothetical protein
MSIQLTKFQLINLILKENQQEILSLSEFYCYLLSIKLN